jgi:hypothetical protein
LSTAEFFESARKSKVVTTMSPELVCISSRLPMCMVESDPIQQDDDSGSGAGGTQVVTMS